MAPRKAHKKSRNGCDQCKLRRVKCGEERPTCRNCTKRELSCKYSEVVPAARSESGNAPESVRSGPSPPISANLETNAVHVESIDRRSPVQIRELGLMHHWTTTVAPSLCQNTERGLKYQQDELNLWQVEIPAEALKFDYLMNALLAFSSLHVMDHPEQSRVSADLETALEYHTASCTRLRTALNSVDENNCHALYAGAIMMIITVITLPPPPSDGATRSSPMSVILDYADLILISRDVLGSLKGHLENGPFRHMVQHWTFQHDYQCRPETHAIMEQLRTLNETKSEESHPDEALTAFNAVVIDHLEYTWAELDNWTNQGGSIAWLGSLESPFIEAIRQHRPMQLAIFACWAAMLDQPSYMWWCKQSGKALIQELCSFQKFEDEKWGSIISWAKNRAEGVSS